MELSIADSPIALAGLVWLIEWYGHKFHKPWSFELGVPLGRKTELLPGAIPIPVPEHWVNEFNVEVISGSRLTFTPDTGDETARCFGVLTLRPAGTQTEARYACFASFGPLAFSVAVVAWVRMHGHPIELAAIGAAILLGSWAFYSWRHKKSLDQTYETLTASLARSAVERSL